MACFTSISPTALMRLPGTQQGPVVLDIGLDNDVNDDPLLVPKARRWPHDALPHMVDVIRAADTDTNYQSAQGARLRVLIVGLSRTYSDNLAQLDAGMSLYDTLYRWFRDGGTETHTWYEA